MKKTLDFCENRKYSDVFSLFFLMPITNTPNDLKIVGTGLQTIIDNENSDCVTNIEVSSLESSDGGVLTVTKKNGTVSTVDFKIFPPKIHDGFNIANGDSGNQTLCGNLNVVLNIPKAIVDESGIVTSFVNKTITVK